MEGEGAYAAPPQPAGAYQPVYEFKNPQSQRSGQVSVSNRSVPQQPLIQPQVDHGVVVEQYNGIPLGNIPPPQYQEQNPYSSPREAAGGLQVQAADYSQVHEELRRLDADEQVLLSSQGLSPAEAKEIKEQFFHQRMNLLMRLPAEEQARYQPTKKSRRFLRQHSERFEVEDEYHRPIFCLSTCIVCVALLIASIGVNGWSVAGYSENPMIGPSTATLDSLGAKNAYDIRHGQGWRWIAPIFLHAGVIHLVINMVVLLRLGVSMEEAFGTVRVAIIFLWSGIFGNLTSCIFLPGGISVGASGALFGLIGALFGDFAQNHKTMAEGKWVYFVQLCISTIIGLCIGLLPLLDNFCHIGGFVSGVFLGMVFLAGAFKNRKGKRYWAPYGKVLAIVAFSGILALTIAMFVVFYNGLNGSTWCPNCKYLACIDASWAPWSCTNTYALEQCGTNTPPAECAG